MFASITRLLARLSLGLLKQAFVLLILVFGVLIGVFLSTSGKPAGDGHLHETTAASTMEAAVWTCSMHPQVRQPNPGKCPICHMDLIQLEDDGGDATAAVLTLSENAAKMIRIETVPAERRAATYQVRMVGKVDYDETRLAYITSWIPGRLDNLYVDYTGIEVNKGDHLANIYSPELLNAQEELRNAAATAERIRSDSPEVLRNTARRTLEAAREKLRRWGLTPAQVTEAEKTGIASDHITIYAPIGGTVIKREGQEGMYVDTGTAIYTLADMKKMWVMLDAYESDLTWLTYGQRVSFVTEAYPGERFEGRIAFIDPFLNEMTRTVKVRVNVENPAGRLKPGMFVRAVAEAEVSLGGRVLDASLRGKWISPMHPEIVKEGPGACDICGMALVPAEQLGFADNAAPEMKPLVIPATAPLLTGKRAVVYVETDGGDSLQYEGREIVLGPRAGDYYLVREGLREGERVVVNGSFKLDSALQILAKPSMMNPSEDGQTDSPMVAHEMVGPELTAVLKHFLAAYLDFQSALAMDNADQAALAASALVSRFEELKSTLDAAHARTLHAPLATLNPAIEALGEVQTLEEYRKALQPLSTVVGALVEHFGNLTEAPLHEIHCPMAFDFAGANWWQAGEAIRNPYFGDAMYSCGTEVRALPTVSAKGADHV